MFKTASEEFSPKVFSRAVYEGKNLDKTKPSKIYGIFDDDGYEINSDLIKKPSLCLICVHDNDLNEEFFCNMTRFDQQGEQEFKCFAYKKIDF